MFLEIRELSVKCFQIWYENWLQLEYKYKYATMIVCLSLLISETFHAYIVQLLSDE